MHAYLNTRVTIFAGSLLTDEQIEGMPRLDLEDIAKKYHLSGLDNSGLPVDQQLRAIELAFIYVILDELLVLLRPMYGEARELLMHWARKFELFNLKALIRGKLNGLPEADIRASLCNLPPYLALPHESLLRTESVLELLRQLEKGQYRAIAGQARQAYEEHRESFTLEAALDQRYYSGIVKRARHLPISDRDGATRVAGLLVDRVSLIWLLRYRFVYQLPPSEAYYQLVHSPQQLFRDRLLALVNMPTFERVLEALPPLLAAEVAGAQSITEVERRMHVLTNRNLRSVVAHNSSTVARAFAYMILRELDLKRIFAAVQGRLLGLDGDVLQTALGLKPESVQAAA